MVERGVHLSSKLGCPTANIAIEQGSIIPGFGVYTGKTFLRGVSYPSLVYIHHSQEKMHLKIEVHLIGQMIDLMGELLEIVLCEKLRDLVLWPGEEKMRSIVVDDLAKAKAWFLGRTC